MYDAAAAAEEEEEEEEEEEDGVFRCSRRSNTRENKQLRSRRQHIRKLTKLFGTAARQQKLKRKKRKKEVNKKPKNQKNQRKKKYEEGGRKKEDTHTNNQNNKQHAAKLKNHQYKIISDNQSINVDSICFIFFHPPKIGHRIHYSYHRFS